MSSIDFEFDLSDTEREVQHTVHRFAEKVMRPVGQKLDKLADPQQVIDKDSILWDAFDQYEQLGINVLGDDDFGLSPVEQARMNAIVLEELGWGDAGLACTLGTRSGGFPQMFASLSGNPDLIERFNNDDHKDISCWAITEPDHGSDALALTEPHFGDPSVKANCIVSKEGDEYVIRGQKSAWVSCGPIATVAALYCTIEGDRGFEGGGIALVPLDLPGVTKGKPLDKIGLRALPQGEIFLDEVRIPGNYMVVGQEAYKDTLNMTLTLTNTFMGSVFAGVARSAYDIALEYAGQRVQGGKTINQHQSVKLRLFDMFRKVETAAAFARKTQIYNGVSPQGKLHLAIASKTYCTRVAFDVASEALQMLGSNGLSREYPIEKIMRDARASMIMDGCNEVLNIVGGSRLD